MRKCLILLLLICSAFGCDAAIKFFTDYANSVPVDSDFFVLQRNQSYINASGLQTKGYLFSNPLFTGTATSSGNFVVQGVLYGNGGGLTNIGGLNFLPITNGNGTNESFWGVTFFQEVDALNFFPTNLFTFLTNAQYLATDGNGKVIAGTGLPATNVLLSAGANITFSTNAAGQITIATSGTNFVQTTTNNTFVNTNLMILQSNATFTIKKGGTVVFENPSTLIDSNTQPNTVAFWDGLNTLTNVANGYGVLTNNGTGSVGFNSAYPQGSGSAITNIPGAVITGGTKTWQFDGSFLWPGDTLPATWTTNTPGAGSSSIQSAGPSIKAWQFSTSATNQVLLQVPMPADWDQSTVNVWINLVSGTNSATANAITNTWGCSAARVGTALGTAILVTNNLPGGTALIETNVDFSTLTIAGSPKPGDYCLFQFQSRGGVTPFSATNTLLGVSFGIRYGVTNIQNNAIQWP